MYAGPEGAGGQRMAGEKRVRGSVHGNRTPGQRKGGLVWAEKRKGPPGGHPNGHRIIYHAFIVRQKVKGCQDVRQGNQRTF